MCERLYDWLVGADVPAIHILSERLHLLIMGLGKVLMAILVTSLQVACDFRGKAVVEG